MGEKQCATYNNASIVIKFLTILPNLSFTHTGHSNAKGLPLRNPWALRDGGQKDDPLVGSQNTSHRSSQRAGADQARALH